MPSSSMKVKLPEECEVGEGNSNARREDSASATEFLQGPPSTMTPPSRMKTGVRSRGASAELAKKPFQGLDDRKLA